MMTATLLALTLSASAADPAWYDPDKVAGASTVFASIAELLGPAFQDAESRVRSMGAGLESLDVGVGLLGAQAPEGFHSWAMDVRRQATGEQIRLQRHLGLLQDDCITEFGRALERALPVVSGGASVKECARGAVDAMVGRGAVCEGTDLSGALAAKMDQDAALKGAVEEIRALPWPDLTTPNQAWAPTPVSGTTVWVSATALHRAFLKDRVLAMQDELTRGLDALDEQLQAGDADALAKATTLRERYDAALAAEGAKLMAAMAASFERGERKGGPKGVGICGNPSAFGGCTGSNNSKAVITWLKADKKFARELGG